MATETDYLTDDIVEACNETWDQCTALQDLLAQTIFDASRYDRDVAAERRAIVEQANHCSQALFSLVSLASRHHNGGAISDLLKVAQTLVTQYIRSVKDLLASFPPTLDDTKHCEVFLRRIRPAIDDVLNAAETWKLENNKLTFNLTSQLSSTSLPDRNRSHSMTGGESLSRALLSPRSQQPQPQTISSATMRIGLENSHLSGGRKAVDAEKTKTAIRSVMQFLSLAQQPKQQEELLVQAKETLAQLKQLVQMAEEAQLMEERQRLATANYALALAIKERMLVYNEKVIQKISIAAKEVADAIRLLLSSSAPSSASSTPYLPPQRKASDPFPSPVSPRAVNTISFAGASKVSSQLSQQEQQHSGTPLSPRSPQHSDFPLSPRSQQQYQTFSKAMNSMSNSYSSASSSKYGQLSIRRKSMVPTHGQVMFKSDNSTQLLKGGKRANNSSSSSSTSSSTNRKSIGVPSSSSDAASDSTFRSLLSSISSPPELLRGQTSTPKETTRTTSPRKEDEEKVEKVTSTVTFSPVSSPRTNKEEGEEFDTATEVQRLADSIPPLPIVSSPRSASSSNSSSPVSSSRKSSLNTSSSVSPSPLSSSSSVASVTPAPQLDQPLFKSVESEKITITVNTSKGKFTAGERLTLTATITNERKSRISNVQFALIKRTKSFVWKKGQKKVDSKNELVLEQQKAKPTGFPIKGGTTFNGRLEYVLPAGISPSETGEGETSYEVLYFLRVKAGKASLELGPITIQ